MKMIRNVMFFLLMSLIANNSWADEEVYFPSNVPLRYLCISMKHDCISGKLKARTTDALGKSTYKRIYPAKKIKKNYCGNLTVEMEMAQKKITKLTVVFHDRKLFDSIAKDMKSSYNYHKVIGEDQVFLDNSIAKVVLPQQAKYHTFPLGTGAVLRVEKNRLVYQFVSLSECLEYAAGVGSDGDTRYTIDYPADLPFGTNIASLNEEKAKFITMSPNSYCLPLKEVFNADKAGTYIEALALDAGRRLTERQIGMKRLLSPEEAGLASRDILIFSVLTDYNYNLTGMQCSFRFRKTYDLIHESLSMLCEKREQSVSKGEITEFYFLPKENLCLVLYRAEPQETQGVRGKYKLMAYNYSLGKVLCELYDFYKSKM